MKNESNEMTACSSLLVARQTWSVLARVLLVTSSIAGVWWYTDQSFEREREAARRIAFANIANLLHLDEHDKILPLATLFVDGVELWSWRFQALIDAQPIAQSERPNWALRWDSDDNSRFRRLGKGVFFDEPNGCTFAMAITGPDTAFDSTAKQRVGDLERDLIVVTETALCNVHWMEPGDIDVRTLSSMHSEHTSRNLRRGFHVLFADGEVWLLRYDVPIELLKSHLVRSSARTHDRDTDLARFAVYKWRPQRSQL